MAATASGAPVVALNVLAVAGGHVLAVAVAAFANGHVVAAALALALAESGALVVSAAASASVQQVEEDVAPVVETAAGALA
eukprot:5845123-Alexandrium_andersonii.AAC.1